MKQHPNKRAAEKTKNPFNIFFLLIIETQWIRFYCLEISKEKLGIKKLGTVPNFPSVGGIGLANPWP